MGDMANGTKLVDLSHHINRKSKARHPSPLKDIIKYMGYEGMISFAGGLPHPSLFAFEDATFTAHSPSRVLSADGADDSDKLDTFVLTKAKRDDQSLSLLDALQYGGGTGDASLLNWCRQFIKEVFKPAYENFEILLNAGNTDGWNKVIGLLCEEGDMILVEEATYPSAQALWVPMGCQAVPIGMDSEGMRSDDLEAVLEGFESQHPGVKKPHLLYLVPAGSNPSGTLMGGARKQAIYNICVKHDIIICEDDPYCFLQYESYKLGEVFSPGRTPADADQYIQSLAPSFLQYDYQGRVIRLDTFSKTLAPGNRLGYFVANPVFTERLLRATEVETQAPSGWSQAIVANLLHNWGITGYTLWLSNLRDQYRARRDWMCDAIARNFDMRPSDATNSFVVSVKGGKDIFSFVAPAAGMFIWAKFYLYNSPRFIQMKNEGKTDDLEQAFSGYVWAELAKALVLLTPGSYYTPWQGAEKVSTQARGAQGGIGHFRLAFSMTSREEMEKGVERMAVVLRECWS